MPYTSFFSPQLLLHLEINRLESQPVFVSTRKTLNGVVDAHARFMAVRKMGKSS
jgi:hypothetical protein